jgi:hypothetical protein
VEQLFQRCLLVQQYCLCQAVWFQVGSSGSWQIVEQLLIQCCLLVQQYCFCQAVWFQVGSFSKSQIRARICKRLRSQGIDSASLCSLAGRYAKQGCRSDPPGWESIPGLLKRFTNSCSGSRFNRHLAFRSRYGRQSSCPVP